MKKVKFQDVNISDVFLDHLGNRHIKIREHKVKQTASGDYNPANALIWKTHFQTNKDMEGTFDFIQNDHPVFIEE